MVFPYAVSLLPESAPSPCSKARNSSSSRTPSVMFRSSGGSTNGNAATSPSPRVVIWRMTEARLVRRISGSVKSGRASKSSSE
ncbi:MAG: hypothetical protein BWY91_02378 [bacterium ADurb.BinA028]|nr:MAG: hypothetical protein BWY91_02378 [bacterium ADurb.BinA028]